MDFIWFIASHWCVDAILRVFLHFKTFWATVTSYIYNTFRRLLSIGRICCLFDYFFFIVWVFSFMLSFNCELWIEQYDARRFELFFARNTIIESNICSWMIFNSVFYFVNVTMDPCMDCECCCNKCCVEKFMWNR